MKFFDRFHSKHDMQHAWYCSDATSHLQGNTHACEGKFMRVIQPNPSSQGDSLKSLFNLVSICFFLSSSAIFKDFVRSMPLSNFSNNFLKGYRTVLNTKNQPYVTNASRSALQFRIIHQYKISNSIFTQVSNN